MFVKSAENKEIQNSWDLFQGVIVFSSFFQDIAEFKIFVVPRIQDTRGGGGIKGRLNNQTGEIKENIKGGI